MGTEFDPLKADVGAAREVGDGPDDVSRCEKMLLAACEHRRILEEWRTGKQLMIEHTGFVRDGNRMELRGKLLEVPPDMRIRDADENGRLRVWSREAARGSATS